MHTTLESKFLKFSPFSAATKSIETQFYVEIYAKLEMNSNSGKKTYESAPQ